MIAQFFHFVYKGGRTQPWFPLHLLPKSTKTSTPKDENTELAETVAPGPVYFFQPGLKQQKELEVSSPILASPCTRLIHQGHGAKMLSRQPCTTTHPTRRRPRRE